MATKKGKMRAEQKLATSFARMTKFVADSKLSRDNLSELRDYLLVVAQEFKSQLDEYGEGIPVLEPEANLEQMAIWLGKSFLAASKYTSSIGRLRNRLAVGAFVKSSGLELRAADRKKFTDHVVAVLGIGSSTMEHVKALVNGYPATALAVGDGLGVLSVYRTMGEVLTEHYPVIKGLSESDREDVVKQFDGLCAGFLREHGKLNKTNARALFSEVKSATGAQELAVEDQIKDLRAEKRAKSILRGSESFSEITDADTQDRVKAAIKRRLESTGLVQSPDPVQVITDLRATYDRWYRGLTSVEPLYALQGQLAALATLVDASIRANSADNPPQRNKDQWEHGIPARAMTVLERAGIMPTDARRMSQEELVGIKGIGKATAKTILKAQGR